MMPANTISRVLEKNVPVRPTGCCWEWKGCVEKDGYGVVQVKGRQWRAHRYVYVSWVGEIGNDLQLDHLCRNRLCVNPAHLEPVTCETNINRGIPATKLYCANGHPLFGPNMRLAQAGKYMARVCRTCVRLRMRTWRRNKAA